MFVIPYEISSSTKESFSFLDQANELFQVIIIKTIRTTCYKSVKEVNISYTSIKLLLWITMTTSAGSFLSYLKLL